MPWNEPGGDKDPWSGKKKPSNTNSTPNPADKVTELFNTVSKGGGGKFLFLIPIAALLLWFFAGFYTVDAGQRAVVLKFGQFKEINSPGLHWAPKPIETVEIVEVDRIRSADNHTTMLTKDENIVDLTIEVQYAISDPKAYLFNVLNPDFERNQERGTIYHVMRSAVREVVGRNDMDFIIQTGRGQVEIDTTELMQRILDKYKIGLQVKKVNLKDATAPEQVKDSFDDANRAREDFNRSKNRAETYANKVIPDARGKAARAVEEANAYRDQVVAKSEGNTSRFLNLMKEYQKAPEVTRQRLYLDMMEKVMSGGKKVLLDSSSSNNMLYLPISNDTNAGGSATPIPPPSSEMIERMRNDAMKANAQRQSTRSTPREGR